MCFSNIELMDRNKKQQLLGLECKSNKKSDEVLDIMY